MTTTTTVRRGDPKVFQAADGRWAEPEYLRGVDQSRIGPTGNHRPSPGGWHPGEPLALPDLYALTGPTRPPEAGRDHPVQCGSCPPCHSRVSPKLTDSPPT